MKILWASNGPNVPTGYGVPTKHMLSHLKNIGHEVAAQAFYGIQGGSVNYGDIMVYPAQGHPYGVDVIDSHAAHFGADLVITLMDLWVFPLDYGQRFNAAWLAWFPVDGKPAPHELIRRAVTADYLGVFSQDGVEVMEEAGLEAEYLPYGVDCDIFHPGDKDEARTRLNFPSNAFLVVTVAANRGYPARKAWPELLLAFKRFRARHSDAMLYLHTRARHISEHGIMFAPLLRDLSIPAESVVFVPQDALTIGIPNEDLADLYRAADVMLLPSMAEGFGLPIAEAQACGCPVITQACSSMAELTVNGIAVEPLQPFWVPILNYWWELPSVIRVDRALETIYCWSEADRIRSAQAGIKHFRNHYHWPVVFDRYWIPLLERIESELW